MLVRLLLAVGVCVAAEFARRTSRARGRGRGRARSGRRGSLPIQPRAPASLSRVCACDVLCMHVWECVDAYMCACVIACARTSNLVFLVSIIYSTPTEQPNDVIGSSKQKDVYVHHVTRIFNSNRAVNHSLCDAANHSICKTSPIQHSISYKNNQPVNRSTNQLQTSTQNNLSTYFSNNMN